MITLITGFPGSGKSYLSVKKIFDELKIGKYDFIYTNINGFKFDKSEKFKRFNEGKFETFLKELHKLYLDNIELDDVDSVLIDYCKVNDYHNCLFVFDECHNFFSAPDDSKIFWLTYHRHLYHEIDLITQNKSLINTKYRGIIETFIVAQQISKNIFKNKLTYIFYSDYKSRHADRYNTISIKKDPKIFELYKSGNMSFQKSILVKFFVIAFVGLSLSTVLFMNAFGYFEDKPEVKEVEKKPKIEYHGNVNKFNFPKKVTDTVIVNNLLINFKCDTESGCMVNNTLYPEKYFNYFIKDTKSKPMLKTVNYKDGDFSIYTIMLATNQRNINKYFISNTRIKTQRSPSVPSSFQPEFLPNINKLAKNEIN